MASVSTTFTTFGTAARAGSIGGSESWGTPGNAQTNDGSRATYGTNISKPWSDNYTFYLTATQLTDLVPSGATIDGIEVVIERRTNHAPAAETWKDSAVYLIKGGTIQTGTNKAVATSYTGTDAAVTYGGAADLWGIALTDTDVNGSGFGAAISCAISGASDPSDDSVPEVDSITVTVYYTESTPVYTIASFQGFEDDGPEDGETPKASADTDWSNRADRNFVVRFLMQCSGSGESNFQPAMEYRINQGAGYGAWTAVTSAAHIYRATSTLLTNGGDTTQQLGAGSYTADNNGIVSDATDVVSTFDTVSGEELELLWVMALSRTLCNPGDTIQVRPTKNGTSLDTYDVTPTITVLASPPPFNDLPASGGGVRRFLMHLGG